MNEPRRWLDTDDSDHSQHRSLLAQGKAQPKRPLDSATRKRLRQRVAAVSATAIGASVFVGWLKALAAGLGVVVVVAGATVATLAARDATRGRTVAQLGTTRPAQRSSRAMVPSSRAVGPSVESPAPRATPAPSALPESPVVRLGVSSAPSVDGRRRVARPIARASEAASITGPAPTSPTEASAVATVAAPSSAPSSLPSTPSTSMTNAPSPPAAERDEDVLTRERLMLEPARAALARDPAAALAAIERYQRTFEQGQLLAESEYIAIEALRRSGRVEQANARADALVRRFPSSVYATLLRRQRTDS
jgi:hypothetical protein